MRVAALAENCKFSESAATAQYLKFHLCKTKIFFYICIAMSVIHS